MAEETFADRVKYYIPPELRGIPQGLAAVNKMFNPVEILRDAGGKSRQFFDSGGKDIQAGIGALTDTALLSAGPVALRIGQAGREPAKMGLKYLQELFYPLGAPDDVAQQAVKIADPSKRDFMKKAGAVGILSAVPAVRGIEEILPVTKTAKAVKASPAVVGGIKEALSLMKKYDNKMAESISEEVKWLESGEKLSKNLQGELEDEAMELLFEMRGTVDTVFRKLNDKGKPITDKQGNSFNKVLDASEKQAVKEMFENMSRLELKFVADELADNMSRLELKFVADELADNDGFLHPDVLDNFLKQINTKPKGRSKNVHDYNVKYLVERITENPFVSENTPIGRDARKILENFTGKKIPVETFEERLK